MKRSRNIGLLAVIVAAAAAAIAVAIAVGYFTRSYFALVALQPIPMGTALSSEMIEEREFSGEAPPGLIDPALRDEFLGRIVTTNVGTEVLLYDSMFYVPGANPDTDNPDELYTNRFSELVPQDAHVLVIQGDPTSNYVRPSDVVDLFYHYVDASGEQFTVKLMTKPVLYVIIPLPPAEGEDVVVTGTVIILGDTDAQEAQDLVHAQETGIVRMAIANPESDNTIPTELTDFEYFWERYGSGEVPNAPGDTSEEPTEEPAPTEEPTTP